MVATADIRFKRIKREVENLHDTRDETLDKVDSLGAAILGLNDTVVANHEWSQREFAELHEKLDAIIKHLDVPYKPVGIIEG